MTITSTPSEVSYAGDGVTTDFPIPFVFTTSADLKVFSTDSDGEVTDLTTGWTTSGGAGSTGTLIFSVAPSADVDITILDDPEIKQGTSYISNDPFPAKTHEGTVDYLTRICKRLAQKFARTLHTDDGDPISDLTLGSVDNRKGKFLFFNAITGAIEYALSLGETIISQSIIAQLLYPQTDAEDGQGVAPTNYEFPADDPYYDVRRTGTVLDNSTDDTAAFQEALNAAPTNGGCVFVPRGIGHFAGSIVWPTSGDNLIPIRILGASGHTVPFGNPQSMLRYSGSGTMFDLRKGTGANTTGVITLENIALRGEQGSGVAIDAYNIQGSVLKNVAIGYFDNAIQIDGFAYYCNFDYVTITNTKSIGWRLRGVLNGTKFHRCRVNTIDNNGPVSGVGIGWDIDGGGTLTFDGCWLENVRTGVRLADTQQAVFRNTYWESCIFGAYVDTDTSAIVHQLDFDGCHFYHVHNGSSLVFSNNVADVYISVKDLGVQQNGGLSNTRIINSTGTQPYAHLDRIVSLTGSEVTAGLFTPWTYLPPLNAAIQSFFTFTNGDATPDVSVGDRRSFSTFNTGATTITALDNGRIGQEIIIRFGDSNTAIDFTGTTLKGHGGADWNPGTGDFMRCVFDGTNWLCTVTEI